MVSVGIIGVGRWGKNILRVMSTIADVKACSVHVQNSQEAQKLFPTARWTNNYQEILDNSEIEAVVITTPISTHYTIAKQALEAGKHVLVEKPLCQKTTEAEELAAIARRQKKIIMVGHIFLHHPVFNEIMRIHRHDPIMQIVSHWNKLGTFEENIVDNLVSHEVALSLAIFSEQPKKVTVLNHKGTRTKCDEISVLLEFSSKQTHTLNVNRNNTTTNKIVQFTTKKGISYQWEQNRLEQYDAHSHIFKPIFSSDEEPLLRECRSFINAIVSDQKSITDIELGSRVVEVLSKIHSESV